MKAWFRKVAQPVMAPLIFRWLNRDMNFSYEGITITVFRGVFHPKYFYSTKVILNKIELEGKKLIELVAGSGIIAFYAGKKGAMVTASDVSKATIVGLLKNKEALNFKISIIESNLFANIPTQHFDYVLINPPYFPKTPVNDKEKAWFCGENFEYFERLFSELKAFMNGQATVTMVLSEDCNMAHVKKLVVKYNIGFELI
jgi:release factor glutamine methyltransferase